MLFFLQTYEKPTNTFQSVLVTDGSKSFVIFNYGDINWTVPPYDDPSNPVVSILFTPAYELNIYIYIYINYSIKLFYLSRCFSDPPYENSNFSHVISK